MYLSCLLLLLITQFLFIFFFISSSESNPFRLVDNTSGTESSITPPTIPPHSSRLPGGMNNTTIKQFNNNSNTSQANQFLEGITNTSTVNNSIAPINSFGATIRRPTAPVPQNTIVPNSSVSINPTTRTSYAYHSLRYLLILLSLFFFEYFLAIVHS